MANTHKKIQTVTVGSGGSATISFTNIPQTYTDLVVRLSGRTDRSASVSDVLLTYNGSTSSFTNKILTGKGTSVNSYTSTREIGTVAAASTTSSTFGNAEFIIPNYVGSNYKSASGDYVTEGNSTTDPEMGFMASLWSNTAAITSITLTPNVGSFVQYTTATLYGVFKENVSGAPSAPSLTATAGDGTTASIAVTPSGQTASLYTVTSSPGSITATGFSSPITVTGLTANTSYTFTGTAANPLGTSAASSASNSVTPTFLLGGFFAGGYVGSDYVTSINKVVFSTDATSTISSTLSAATGSSASFSSSTNGYVSTGYNSSGFTNVTSKLLYSTQVVSAVSSNIANPTGAPASFQSSSAGYIAGGGTPDTATVTKLLFSNESNSTLSTGLSLARRYCFGFYSSSDGYVMGGYTSPSIRRDGDKYSLSTETRSTFLIPNPANYGAGTFVTSSYGYYAGGQESATTSSIRKMTFSSDSISTISATLSAAGSALAGMQSSTAGYVTGFSTAVDKITFSTDARTTLASTLAYSAQGPVGFAKP